MRCSVDLLKLYDKLKSKLVISGERKGGVRTAFHHICKVFQKILHRCGEPRQRVAPGRLEGMPGSRDVMPDALVAQCCCTRGFSTGRDFGMGRMPFLPIALLLIPVV
jgi:hypothetical protein